MSAIGRDQATETSKLGCCRIHQTSSYCFSKVLDFLFLNHLHYQGLSGEPVSPTIDDTQKSRFEKIVKYDSPGDSTKLILG